MERIFEAAKEQSAMQFNASAGAVVKQVSAEEMVGALMACLVTLLGGNALSGTVSHPCC